MEQADPDDLGLTDCAQLPPTKAAVQLRKVILLLDLAAQHAREIATRLDDVAARRVIDDHVTSIEASLQVARNQTAAF